MIAAMSPSGQRRRQRASFAEPADTVATDDSFRRGRFGRGPTLPRPGGGDERRSVHGSSSLAAEARPVASAARRSQSVRLGAFDSGGGLASNWPKSRALSARGSGESPGEGDAQLLVARRAADRRALARTSTSFAAAAVATAGDVGIARRYPGGGVSWDVRGRIRSPPVAVARATISARVDGDRAAGQGGTAVGLSDRRAQRRAVGGDDERVDE